MGKIKVVFFGTPKIALKSLKEIFADENFELMALVTQAPKPSGRGKKINLNELKEFAIENNITVFEPAKIGQEPVIIENLRTIGADFFITFAFGQILTKEVLEIPHFGTINLHASLLPKYRGANPIRAALLNGENTTGVTTMLTVLELDAGDICKQAEIKLDENINSIELTEKISEISSNLIKETLIGLKKGEITPIAQEHTLATFSKKSKKEDKIIIWNESFKTIHNKIRALVDNFTLQTTFEGKIVKITKSQLAKLQGEAGTVLEISKNGITVGCGENSILIQTLKPEGKNEMSAYNWSLGARLKIGDRFD